MGFYTLLCASPNHIAIFFISCRKKPQYMARSLLQSFSLSFSLSFSFFNALPLPAQQTVGLFLNDSLAFNGYTLLIPNSNTNTYLLDNCGEVVHGWASGYRPGNVAYLLENGNLLRTGRIPNSSFNAGGSGGHIELQDWDGNLLWSYDYSSAAFQQHHDVEYLPNGNILLIAWELHSREEAIEAGRNPAFVSNNGLWSERVVELQPAGASQANVVWMWRLWDHLIQDYDPSKDNYGAVADHPELVDINFATGQPNNADWIHLNAVDYNPALDQIVLCSRSLSEFWVIDHSATTGEAAGHTGGNAGRGGDILYRWGNPRAYRRGAAGDQKLFYQHDAHWIEEGLPGAGQIMVFNNGLGRPGGNHSTVDVIEPPLDENGSYILEESQPYGPAAPFWTYRAQPPSSFFSPNISGAQRLPNGNTLICEGDGGRLFEVDVEGRVHWEYINPVRAGGPVMQGANINNNTVFRAYRYAPGFPAFEGKILAPQGPLELNPFPSDCLIYDAPLSYAPEAAKALAGLRVLANPVGDALALENETGERLQLQLFSLAGRLVAQDWVAPGRCRLPAALWPPGVYLLRAGSPASGKWLVQKIVKI